MISSFPTNSSASVIQLADFSKGAAVEDDPHHCTCTPFEGKDCQKKIARNAFRQATQDLDVL
ncbi:hypothetical protein M378DRAFT_851012 [Amanita muscaria Koide BX008]|uniref:Uncharacterized protein n=1 Tax=Amanita muscaria (strain Koide BX008) TaxID=946122 RepID=A0A0C2WJB2_AMAMK|nr:hypothetical protein M378DRAFT_851012 [Amanita muscaria Koide BX008]